MEQKRHDCIEKDYLILRTWLPKKANFLAKASVQKFKMEVPNFASVLGFLRLLSILDACFLSARGGPERF